jgi:muramoyltetrapeptide carboxypeptidase
VPRLCKPHALPPGGTIAIAAPAAAVDPVSVASCEAQWKAAGFRTLRRDDLFARQGYLAGDDARRAEELMGFVGDARVDAIVCARGGYGSQRIVERLEPARVRAARKPLVGYSDITTLLLWQRRCVGLVGFHGPMLERSGGLEPAELDALAAALCGREAIPQVRRGRGGGGGRAEGRLVGGSLSLIAASLGTPWEIDTQGAILLLEDVGERPYRIDRMLQHLRAAGKLTVVAGVGLGAFTRCDEEGASAAEVLREALAGLRVPWVEGLPFGHTVPNLPWPLGVMAMLDGGRGELHILERGVARR